VPRAAPSPLRSSQARHGSQAARRLGQSPIEALPPQRREGRCCACSANVGALRERGPHARPSATWGFRSQHCLRLSSRSFCRTTTRQQTGRRSGGVGVEHSTGATRCDLHLGRKHQCRHEAKPGRSVRPSQACGRRLPHAHRPLCQHGVTHQDAYDSARLSGRRRCQRDAASFVGRHRAGHDDVRRFGSGTGRVDDWGRYLSPSDGTVHHRPGSGGSGDKGTARHGWLSWLRPSSWLCLLPRSVLSARSRPGTFETLSYELATSWCAR